MKTKTYLIIIFLFTGHICFASEQDSIEVVKNDSLSNLEIEKNKKGIDFILTGGLGIATGSTWDDWEEIFNPGPALMLGLEIPIVFDNSVSLIFLGHFQVSSVKEGFFYDSVTIAEYARDYLKETFIEVSDDLYAQLGFSTGIGFHINEFESIDTNLSLKGSFSYYLLHPGSDYHLFNLGEGDYHLFHLGLSLNYQLSKTLSVNLKRIITFPLNIPLAGGSVPEDVPNFLILNLCYKFKW